MLSQSHHPNSQSRKTLTKSVARAALVASALALLAGCGILKTRSEIESQDSKTTAASAGAAESSTTTSVSETNLQNVDSNSTTVQATSSSLSQDAYASDMNATQSQSTATAGSTLDRDLLALGATPPPVAPTPMSEASATVAAPAPATAPAPTAAPAPATAQANDQTTPPPAPAAVTADKSSKTSSESEVAPLPPEKRPFAPTPPTSPYVKKGDRKKSDRPVNPPAAESAATPHAAAPAEPKLGGQASAPALVGTAAVAPVAASTSASGLDRFMNKPYTVNYGSAQSTLLIENANTILLTTQNGPQSRTVERIPATISGLRPGVFMISGRKEDRTAFTMVSDFEQGLVKSQFVYPDQRTEKLEGSLTQQ